MVQHDNVPVHKMWFSKTWFAMVGVEEIERPAQSPDVNPIEHLDKLECQMCAKPISPDTILMLLWLNGQIPTHCKI